MCASGTVFEGPSDEALDKLARMIVEPVCNLMSEDGSPIVKDSAAWVLGRVCDQVSRVALEEQYRRTILNTLGQGLSEQARVAQQACWVRLHM